MKKNPIAMDVTLGAFLGKINSELQIFENDNRFGTQTYSEQQKEVRAFLRYRNLLPDDLTPMPGNPDHISLGTPDAPSPIAPHLCRLPVFGIEYGRSTGRRVEAPKVVSLGKAPPYNYMQPRDASGKRITWERINLEMTLRRYFEELDFMACLYQLPITVGQIDKLNEQLMAAEKLQHVQETRVAQLIIELGIDRTQFVYPGCAYDYPEVAPRQHAQSD